MTPDTKCCKKCEGFIASVVQDLPVGFRTKINPHCRDRYCSCHTISYTATGKKTLIIKSIDGNLTVSEPPSRNMSTKIIAADYKGKWFVLQDADVELYSGERPEINIDWVVTDGLRNHVENCRYYGIPAYVGRDNGLHAKIIKIEDELDALESAST